MKIALFGASGFVGSNLAYRLSRNPSYQLTLCDLEDAKLRLRFENENFTFEPLDISQDVSRIDEIVSDADLVFDLAAYVHPAMFLRQPLDVVKLNFFDCLNVINSCVRHKTRLIHFSTSEVYGKTGGSTEPFKEDETDCILGPIANQRWIYSCAKQLLDRMIYAHGVQHGLEYTLVRPFNFIGPLMDRFMREWRFDDNPRVLANFLSALVYNRDLRLVDGGHSRRCFTFIEDATAALEAIVENPGPMARQIVNVGNPANEISIRGLAERMADIYVSEFEPSASPRITEVSSETFYGEGYEDCDRRMPDISKLTAIGWAPRFGLDETLRRTMGYWVNNKERLVDYLGD
jgi:UDP-apiose/xylose synthase